MRVCFRCLLFSFLSKSQAIGWEERLQNDLLCVEWDIQPQLSQSSSSSRKMPTRMSSNIAPQSINLTL